MSKSQRGHVVLAYSSQLERKGSYLLSSEPKPYERVGNNGTWSISIGEQGNKGNLKLVREQEKEQEYLGKAESKYG